MYLIDIKKNLELHAMHVFCQLLSASIQQKMRAFATAGTACHIR